MARSCESIDIEGLLERPYWIIDVLPKQVPSNGAGQYFAVERFFLEEPNGADVRRRHANVLLKLNCYYDVSVSCDAGETWETNPQPAALAEWAGGGLERMYVLVKPLNALFVLDAGDTYATVYGLDEALLELVRELARSEGLFVWQLPEE